MRSGQRVTLTMPVSSFQGQEDRAAGRHRVLASDHRPPRRSRSVRAGRSGAGVGGSRRSIGPSAARRRSGSRRRRCVGPFGAVRPTLRSAPITSAQFATAARAVADPASRARRPESVARSPPGQLPSGPRRPPESGRNRGPARRPGCRRARRRSEIPGSVAGAYARLPIARVGM